MKHPIILVQIFILFLLHIFFLLFLLTLYPLYLRSFNNLTFTSNILLIDYVFSLHFVLRLVFFVIDAWVRFIIIGMRLNLWQFNFEPFLEWQAINWCSYKILIQYLIYFTLLYWLADTLGLRLLSFWRNWHSFYLRVLLNLLLHQVPLADWRFSLNLLSFVFSCGFTYSYQLGLWCVILAVYLTGWAWKVIPFAVIGIS